MTAFVTADIPAAINTVEELFMWCALLLKNNNPTDQLTLEASNNTTVKVDVITNSHFNDAARGRRFYCQVYLPVDPSYDFDRSRKLWTFAKEIGTVPTPAAFKAD